MYFLELILTKKCNQTCSYCNVFPLTKYKKEPIVVDIDYIKYALSCFNCDLYVGLCGGEPGVIENLDDVFKTVYDHPQVKRIRVMTNGLIRKRGFDWITNSKVIYNEHLIKDIDDKQLIKFYPELDFEPAENRRYVIVTTEKTITSLMNNYEYYKELGLFENQFWYKILVKKVHSIESFTQPLIDFYKLINQSDLKVNLQYIKYVNGDIDPNRYRTMCAINSPLPGIDLETKELMHCCCDIKRTSRVPFNADNVQSLLDMKLFNKNVYCDECYAFDDSPYKIKCMLETKKKNYINQGTLFEDLL